MRTSATSRIVKAVLATGFVAGCLSSWLSTSSLDHQLKLQQEQREETLFLLEQKAKRENTPPSATGNAASAIEQRLSVSWIDLLQTLAQAATPKVNLLVLTPDADNKQIRLQVEADSLPLVLQYIDRLQASSLLDQVHLVHQQPASTINGMPASMAPATAPDKLRFTILAQWVQP